MTRPLRIEYRNAWYHVMNRGRRGETVFTNRDDYRLFLNVLQETVDLWQINICGYCLMPNHYHLLVQTPNANLSRCMQHINGVYTQRFNRRHKIDGPLFRGRYKSILIGEDNYLIELLRYICFNPVRAGLVATPEAYAWSCYSDYLSTQLRSKWLNRDLVIERFQLEKNKGLYKDTLLSQDAKEEIYQFLNRKNLPSLLGSNEFIDKIRNQFFDRLVHPEKPSSRDLAIETDRIISTVCRYFGINKNNVFHQARGITNTPRDIAVYLIRVKSMSKLDEIAKIFNFSNYKGVSSAIERIKRQLQTESDLVEVVDELERQLLNLGQKEI